MEGVRVSDVRGEALDALLGSRSETMTMVLDEWALDRKAEVAGGHGRPG
jgi:hypothetical protein